MLILKVLVGSQAHGLADEDSDHDFRGVYVNRTSDILRLGPAPKDASWIEKAEGADDTAWELRKFLDLSLQCNPTLLECYFAPVVDANAWGLELRSLFPCVWSAERVRAAFVGYAINQRKKMLDDKDGKARKYAAACIRAVIQAENLLRSGVLPVSMLSHPLCPLLRKIRRSTFSPGEVVDIFESMRDQIDAISCEHIPDVEPINDFLLRVRKGYW